MENTEKPGIREKIRGEGCWQKIACILIFCGLILFPIHVRYAVLKDSMGMYSRLNFPLLLALLIFLILKAGRRTVTGVDVCMVLLWTAGGALMVVSNVINEVKTARTVTAIFGLVVPLLFLLVRIGRENYASFMKVFLIGFDLFIAVLLVFALVERFDDDFLLRTFIAHFPSDEFSTYLSHVENGTWRFFSLWGHALTNATFFTGFFIVNDQYFRGQQRRYPKLLFFVAALLGVALCSSKTAIVVLLAYMVVSCWDDKRLLLGGAAVGILLLLTGTFNSLIGRFLNSSLTTGRAEALLRYFQTESQNFPIHFLTGYGSNSVYQNLYDLKAGFEFPLMMSSMDYGLLAAVLVLVTLYVYVSCHMLRRRKILCWIGFSLLYAQYHTYNGLSLSNQDCFAWCCVFTMILLNTALFAGKEEKAPGPEEETALTEPNPVGYNASETETASRSRTDSKELEAMTSRQGGFLCPDI